LRRTGRDRQKKDFGRSAAQISNLKTQFFTGEGIVRAVDGVDLTSVREKPWGGRGVGFRQERDRLLVLNLIAYPGRVVAGEVFFRGRTCWKNGRRR